MESGRRGAYKFWLLGDSRNLRGGEREGWEREVGMGGGRRKERERRRRGRERGREKRPKPQLPFPMFNLSSVLAQTSFNLNHIWDLASGSPVPSYCVTGGHPGGEARVLCAFC